MYREKRSWSLRSSQMRMRMYEGDDCKGRDGDAYAAWTTATSCGGIPLSKGPTKRYDTLSNGMQNYAFPLLIVSDNSRRRNVDTGNGQTSTNSNTFPKFYTIGDPSPKDNVSAKNKHMVHIPSKFYTIGDSSPKDNESKQHKHTTYNSFPGSHSTHALTDRKRQTHFFRSFGLGNFCNHYRNTMHGQNMDPTSNVRQPIPEGEVYTGPLPGVNLLLVSE